MVSCFSAPCYRLEVQIIDIFLSFLTELYIQGNIHTQKGVNLLNVASIAQNAVKLNSSNKFLKSLVFEVGWLLLTCLNYMLIII